VLEAEGLYDPAVEDEVRQTVETAVTAAAALEDPVPEDVYTGVFSAPEHADWPRRSGPLPPTDG
jgi:TPP-dependent pyruvate/acetoin dehydrogenase alpha subunit